MKGPIRYILLFAIFLGVAVANFSFVTSSSSSAKKVQTVFLQQLDSLDNCLQNLNNRLLTLKDKKGVSQAKKAYLDCRKVYKQVEFLVEYYNTTSAKQLNGGLVDEVEEDDPNQRVQKPQGLQVIEELIWADSAWQNRNDLIQEVATAKAVLLRVKQLALAVEFEDDAIFEAIAQEITRIYTLGLAGFDSPAADNSLVEASIAFKSIEKALRIYIEQAPKECKEQVTVLNATYARLDNAFALEKNLSSFNHAYFIQRMVLPFYAALIGFQESLHIPFNGLSTAVYPKASSPFAAKSWNANFYNAEKYTKTNERQVELGKMLFFDPVLSGNNKRACAGCHQPEKAFADGVAKSIAFDFEGTVSRNAPSIINSALQANLFWDGKVSYYEDQVTAVTQNEIEMHGDLKEVVAKLANSTEYVGLFRAAYAGTADTLISSLSLRKAIAAYERSLIGYNSRFDQYLNGNTLAMNAQEIAGFTLFMSKAQCGTCHFVQMK